MLAEEVTYPDLFSSGAFATNLGPGNLALNTVSLKTAISQLTGYDDEFARKRGYRDLDDMLDQHAAHRAEQERQRKLAAIQAKKDAIRARLAPKPINPTWDPKEFLMLAGFRFPVTRRRDWSDYYDDDEPEAVKPVKVKVAAPKWFKKWRVRKMDEKSIEKLAFKVRGSHDFSIRKAEFMDRVGK